MGSHNISFTMPGNTTEKQINAKLEELQEYDRDENGHQQGYSGDWQTIHSIRFHGYKGAFKNINVADDYALSVAEKGEYAVAVKFLSRKPKPASQAITNLRNKIDSTNQDMKNLVKESFDKLKEKKTKTCVACGQKHIVDTLRIAKCLKCRASLNSKSYENKINKLTLKIEKLKSDLELKEEKFYPTEEKWLISGWASS